MADGRNAPRLIYEFVPRLAAEVDDIVRHVQLASHIPTGLIHQYNSDMDFQRFVPDTDLIMPPLHGGGCLLSWQ
jgi:hypothetical protein